MKKLLLLFLFIGFTVVLASKTFAQTEGTLTFSVKTTCPSGQFNPKHLVAIWIQNSSVSGSSSAFIKTKVKYGNNYTQYLNAWKSASTSNTTDATTGATRNVSSETLSFTWNGKNVSGTLVPDGTYYIWMQMTASNTNGATAYLAFTKGPNADHQTGSSGNFTNMTADWTPASAMGITETSGNLSVKCFPNPFTNETTIEYTLEDPAKVSADVYDLQGKHVISLVNDVDVYGKNSIKWVASSDVKPGVYYVSIKAGKYNVVKKVVLSK